MTEGSELSVLYLERKGIAYKPSTLKGIAKKLSTQMLGNAKWQTHTLERISWADNGVWEKKGWDCSLPGFFQHILIAQEGQE